MRQQKRNAPAGRQLPPGMEAGVVRYRDRGRHPVACSALFTKDLPSWTARGRNSAPDVPLTIFAKRCSEMPPQMLILGTVARSGRA